MSGESRHVLIVGAGVIGTACAYYLAKSGRQVTIIDKGRFGKGCSHANCGLVCPSHVIPLAEPGAMGSAFKALFQKNSPLSIKLRFDLSLWRWLYQFARRCNQRDMMEAATARHALLESSLRLYEQLMENEPLQCEWERKGLLFVYQTSGDFENYSSTDKLLRESFGLEAVRYDGDAVAGFEPALRSGLAGGWYYEEEAHLRPDKLMSSWRLVLEQLDVVVKEDCKLTDLVRKSKRASAVITTKGELNADAFIIAAGAWTPRLNEILDSRIPIQPGKGYSITMPRPQRCPAVPLIFPEHRVAVTPMQSGYRLGSTMEFAGYNSTINARRLALLKDGARPYLQEPYCEPVLEEWYGWRPMTYDGKPIIDRSPALDNVWIVAGHNMLGLSMAPATGKLAAEMINGQQPHIDPSPFSVSRF